MLSSMKVLFFSKFMSSKQKQLSESVNSFSKFITVFFPSESHNHEATTTGSNFSRHPILDFAPSDDHNSDNSQNQTNQVPYNASSIHSETQNTSDHSVASENTPVQNQHSQTSQTTPKLNPSHPMITKAKARIFKPKAYNTQKALSLETPSSVEALSDKNLKLAIQDEFDALIKN